MPSAAAILNLAAYKFVELADSVAALEPLRDAARSKAEEHGVRGTVLLAPEGINLFIAGPRAGAREFMSWLRSDPRFADVEAKESWSETLPFKKLLVKTKAEIIRMNRPAVRPEAGRAPAVSSETLARWLDQAHDDEGRPVVMLDTRNAFEVEYGRFAEAVDWKLTKFSEFPDALAMHALELAGHTVVSYCTGGIRCEKAALLMAEIGIQNVLQLEGGILKYLEEQHGRPGSRHFQGECFVFDERRALDAGLRAQGLPPQTTPVTPAGATDRRPAGN